MRDFFDSFAKAAGKDPLIPDNWYKVNARSIIAKVTLDHVAIN